MPLNAQRSTLNAPNGFTLIEAIVVVAITVTLTAIFIVYSRTSEQQILFFREENLLRSTVARAKAFAVETFQPTLESSPGTSALPAEIVCGWGVHFDTTSLPTAQYILFRDAVPLGASCTTSDGHYSGSAETFETFPLHPLLAFGSVCINITPSTACTPPSEGKIDVLFIPPDPSTSFYSYSTAGVVTGAAEALVTLSLASGANTATVRISSSAAIEVY